MLNLSSAPTVTGGKYDLSCFDADTVADPKMKAFVAALLCGKQILYDWGGHQFWTCAILFIVDYDAGVIHGADDTSWIQDGQWIGCTPAELHEALAPVFSGGWGPTAIDTILRMEHSGIRVDIWNTERFGPKDPKRYIEQLRQQLSH